MSARTHGAKRNRTRVRVCISPQHARVSIQKHTITELTHQNKMFLKKKNAHSSTSMRFSHSALWGHCVLCVNVSGIYLLGGGIKVSGGGGSVRACVLVVAMVCVCACACAGGDDACARVRAFVCSCWR